MDHGFMPIVVRVASQEDYDSWLNSQRAEVSSLASQ
jgi:heme/copper-type cytochrome/quinol oxidase subunit 2